MKRVCVFFFFWCDSGIIGLRRVGEVMGGDRRRTGGSKRVKRDQESDGTKTSVWCFGTDSIGEVQSARAFLACGFSSFWWKRSMLSLARSPGLVMMAGG